MRRTALWMLSAAILAVLASACGADAGAGDPPTLPALAATPTPTLTLTASAVLPVPSPNSESSSSAQQQAAVAAAIREAAVRLDLAPDASDVQVEQIEARQWPDASLGCPRQGEQYVQVVTPGYLVVVSAAGKRLEYHADSRGRIVFCQEL